MEGRLTERGLWVAQGGSGEKLLVLLHGLGAHAGVWSRTISLIEKSWAGRWMAPDFRGHGRSVKEGPYGYGVHAADVAALIGEQKPDTVTLAGHSFGGVIAALVASGWFGPQVREVAAFGVKLDWTADEVGKAQEMARRPARAFATRAEAVERALKLAGLFGLVDPDSEDAERGVIAADSGYVVAMDPRTFSAVGPSIENILKLSAAPVRLAAGAKDPMVTLAAMRRLDPNAAAFEGLGHNAHWEAPEVVWKFIQPA